MHRPDFESVTIDSEDLNRIERHLNEGIRRKGEDIPKNMDDKIIDQGIMSSARHYEDLPKCPKQINNGVINFDRDNREPGERIPTLYFDNSTFGYLKIFFLYWVKKVEV